MDPLSLIGAGTGLLGSLFGKGSKAKLPDFTPVDVGKEQTAAIQGNLFNFDRSVSLADQTNQANADQLTSILRRTIPGYDKIVGQYASNLNSQLKGELPSDVADSIMRSTAERGVAGGFSGGGTFQKNLTARDFGLTQMDISNRAMQQSLSYLNTMKSVATPTLIGVQDSFVSPQERIAQANRNSLGVFQAQTAQAQEAARPDPTLASLSGFASQMGGTLFGYGMQRSESDRQFKNLRALAKEMRP